MAYDFIPKNENEILKETSFNTNSEYFLVYNYLTKKYPSYKDPIALSKKETEKKNIKVTRALTGTVNLVAMKRDLKLKLVKITHGEGSRGNRGVNNRGNLFEGIYANDVRRYWQGETITDLQTKKSIDYLVKTYQLNQLKDLKIMEEGAANTKRPVVFQGSQPVISSPTNSLDIGKAVTDLTIKSGQKDIAYLSLKLKNTVTFFNVGTTKFLPKDEIRAGKVTNSNGLIFLKMLGIDPIEFCKPFNESGYQGKKETGKADLVKLKKFLTSGIGYGYCVVHKISTGIKTYTVDKTYLASATQIQSVNIEYGGKTGTGKRVNIVVKTPKYIITMNIRDSAGADGYPNRIMGDFKYV